MTKIKSLIQDLCHVDPGFFKGNVELFNELKEVSDSPIVQEFEKLGRVSDMVEKLKNSQILVLRDGKDDNSFELESNSRKLEVLREILDDFSNKLL